MGRGWCDPELWDEAVGADDIKEVGWPEGLLKQHDHLQHSTCLSDQRQSWTKSLGTDHLHHITRLPDQKQVGQGQQEQIICTVSHVFPIRNKFSKI